MAEPLILESCAGVVRVTLDRPEKRNALSRELLLALARAQQAIVETLQNQGSAGASAAAAEATIRKKPAKGAL